MLDQAFEALKTYDWGTDIAVLAPIEQAVIAAHGDEAAREDLERRLSAVLSSDVSRDAKDYTCRKLMLIGSAASVPALAKLLEDEQLSHMARYALERMEVGAAGDALRDALPNVKGAILIGVIGSLGSRREASSVAALAALLADPDPATATAAARALGAIRSLDAATALAAAKSPASDLRQAIADASLECAEAVLADGDKSNALAIYKQVSVQEQPKHVRLAATRGMLACAGKVQ